MARNTNCYAYSNKEKKQLFEDFLKELDNMADELNGMSDYEAGDGENYPSDSDERAFRTEDAENLEGLALNVYDLKEYIENYLKWRGLD